MVFVFCSPSLAFFIFSTKDCDNIQKDIFFPSGLFIPRTFRFKVAEEKKGEDYERYAEILLWIIYFLSPWVSLNLISNATKSHLSDFFRFWLVLFLRSGLRYRGEKGGSQQCEESVCGGFFALFPVSFLNSALGVRVHDKKERSKVNKRKA